jgi:hypothetical protein
VKIFDGKTYRDMTAEELAEMREAEAKAEAEEKHRPFTESEVTAMFITAQINTLAVDDQTALRMMAYYPDFAELCEQSYTTDKAGFKFVYGGKLYKTVQPVYTFVAHYVPGVGTESLFERIDEQHDGTKYDPTPYEGNMALEKGKYYSQGGVVYVCILDTQIQVSHALAELVGLYVEVVQ